jgi:hypothetical protein
MPLYALENKADAKARLQIEKGEYEIKEVFKSFATNCANGSLPIHFTNYRN